VSDSTSPPPDNGNVLVLAVSKIEQITDARSRERCAAALAASLRCDSNENTPPLIMNADEIEAEFGISKDDQDYYRIVLRRKNIKDFAKYYGKVLKSSDISKFFKTEAYESYFQKRLPRLAGETKQSATVYTYAEVLHRANFRRLFTLPNSVQEFLSEQGINLPD